MKKEKKIKYAVLSVFLIAVSAFASYYLIPVNITGDMGVKDKAVEGMYCTVYPERVYDSDKIEEVAARLSKLKGQRQIDWWWKRGMSDGGPPAERYLTVRYTDGTVLRFVFNSIGKGNVSVIKINKTGWREYKMYDYKELYDCLGLK